jgi:T-complex protein 1 subunit beta
MEALAVALRRIPAILSDNGGYDTQTLVAQLRAQHAAGQRTAGLDLERGAVGDARQLGLTESWLVKVSGACVCVLFCCF